MKSIFALSFLLLTVLSTLSAAPAPTYHKRRVRPIQEVLVGNWVMQWGGTNYAVTLERCGNYRCALGNTIYVGSWNADKDMFRIIESSRPEDSSSWRTYFVKMDSTHLVGVVENSKVVVKLVRVK